MNCPECGEENTEKDKPNAKTSKLAVAALVLGILSTFIFLMVILPEVLGIITIIITIIAIIFGIVALVKINKSTGQLKGKGLAIGGIVVPIVAWPIMLAILMPALGREKAVFERIDCNLKMQVLAVMTMTYPFGNENKLPVADKWCDLLIAESDLNESSFNCMSQPEGSFSYALNKNLTSLKGVPDDIVLIFEADGGRNAAGGPEMLASQRHNGDGCHVAFVDGSVKFVKTKDLGSLKWAPETTKDN